MNYELAKQLKDAGFPQEVFYGGYVIRERDRLQFNIGDSDDMDETTGGYNPHLHRDNTTAKDGYVKVPTLSELITACGDRFNSLSQSSSTEDEPWMAMANNHQGTHEFANTPEEAVAKLWLELNKKK